MSESPDTTIGPEPEPLQFADDTVLTIAQRFRGAPWRVELAHARPHHLLVWLTRGSARAMIEGRMTALGAHNALFIPAGTLFSCAFDSTCFGQTAVFDPELGLDWPEEPLLRRVREPKAQLELTGYIEAIQSEILARAPRHAQAIHSYAQLMLVWAARYSGTQSQSDEIKRPLAAQRLMQAFCALVVQSESKTPSGGSMADFAAKLGVTPTHLARVSKSECGMSAADLLSQHTTQRARRALEDSALPASRIAARLGFSSPAYFTRYMQSHTGLSPTQIRAARSKTAQGDPLR